MMERDKHQLGLISKDKSKLIAHNKEKLIFHRLKQLEDTVKNLQDRIDLLEMNK